MSIANHDINNALSKVLHRTFEHTLRTCAPSSQWQIKPSDSLNQINHDHCIVLTISAFKFRIMCLLHLSLNQRTKNFVAEATATKLEDLDEPALLDYLLELSNSLCGNLKRNLQDTCPPLGMSTPNLLDRSCLTFDDIIDISYSVHTSAVDTPSSHSLFAASALVSLKENHDFKIPRFQEFDTNGDNESNFDNSGELELF